MVSLETLIRSIQFAGLPNVLRAIRFARFKSRLDRLHPSRQISPLPARLPGNLFKMKTQPGGGVFQFESADLEILFLAPDLARITWSPGLPPLSYAISKSEWSIPEIAESQKRNEWFLETTKMQVQVCTDGSLLILDSNGNEIFRQLPPSSRGNQGEETAWTAVSILQPDEHLAGLGEHSGHVNLVGQSHRLWNRSPGGKYGPGSDPLYSPMPVYLGCHQRGSYLVFYENPFPAGFQAGSGRIVPGGVVEFQAGAGLDETDTARFCQFSFEGGLLRYYFILGSPEEALERYTELTGLPGLPPRWALGYHQSRWGYKTAEEIRSVLAGFREHDMPLSAIHLDIDYMDGYRVFSVNQQRFPDLEGLAKDLHTQGVKLVTILDPGVKVDPGYGLYRQGLESGMFCTLPGGRPLVGLVWPGDTVFPDFTNPKVRQWWGEQYKGLIAAGVDGFWHDMNEPEAFSATGDMTLPLATCHFLEGRGGDHHQAHNLYGLLMNRAGYEGLQQHRPDRRPWLVSRAGWAGSPRYAWNWTGDIESTWAGLRLTIAMIINLGLSGQPFSGVDIGGFSGDPDAELYQRWIQMGAFLPFFRTHSAVGTARREPWVYGEPYTSRIRQSLQLRYRLLPYFYTLAHEAAETGHPLVRPLFWRDLGNNRLWEVEDAFLLGDALLVAPVLEPGASTRKLILPGGTWYDFFDDHRLSGDTRVTLAVIPDLIPVLVREGTVLPMDEEEILSLNIYPPTIPGKFSSHLFLDAGDGYPQSVKDWRLDHFLIEDTGYGMELTWETTGEYVFPYRAVKVHLHGKVAYRAWIDGKEFNFQGASLTTQIFKQLRIEARDQ